MSAGVEFPSGVIDKHSTAADRLHGRKVKSTRVVQKLLIESMLKSIQSLLKQQQQQQPGEGERIALLAASGLYSIAI